MTAVEILDAASAAEERARAAVHALDGNAEVEAVAFSILSLRYTLLAAVTGRQEADQPAFEGWALLELMGHRERAGYVREIRLASKRFLEVTLPEAGPDVGSGPELVPGEGRVELYSGTAIYSLTPSTEEQARTAQLRHDEIPF